jgi:SAM-dependent methyltransferase
MHLPTHVRKALFTAFGRLFLSDAVRNQVYQWAWGHLKQLPRGAAVVDIGSRDSLFPAFLAWKRLSVRVVERDARFTGKQHANGRRWNVRVVVDNYDFLAGTVPDHNDAICSLFSLQHAGDDDIAAYRKAAGLLKPGGLFLSATEYRHSGTRFQHGRDDGTMRIYGPEDIDRRIEGPLFREGMVVDDRQYVAMRERGRVSLVNNAPESASIVLLLFKKAGETATLHK